MSGKSFFIICFIIAVGVIIVAHFGDIHLQEEDFLDPVKEKTENITNSTINKAKEKIGFKISNFDNYNVYYNLKLNT